MEYLWLSSQNKYSLNPVQQLFRDLVVLDLSSVLAGPTAGTFFAELGAHVIKVENKARGGDATRQWKLSTENHTGPISAYYAAANFGKEVHLLDFTDSDDYDRVIDLIKSADIIISNFQKRVAEKFQLTPDDLLRLNPNSIVAQLSAFTYEDPRPGYDVVMQAEAGWISMTGTDTEHLAKLPVAMIDIIASHQIREAALLGLYMREKNKKGSIFHISLFDSAISALANQATNYLMNNHVPMPMGTHHPNIAPYGDLFTTKDEKSVILTIGSDDQFEKLGKTLNFTADTIGNFIKNTDRVQKRHELHNVIQEEIEKLDRTELMQTLSDANVPFCIVKNLKEVFENESAQRMIKLDIIEGIPTKAVSQVAFHLSQVSH